MADASISNVRHSPLKFSDLPAEIRDEVYRHVFVLKKPFDFCSAPHPCKDLVHSQSHRKGAIRSYRLDVHLRLAFLRTCRFVNDEASPIFYGQEFRFSSPFGWIMLFHFMRTIGSRNAGFLRNISVHLSFDDCVSNCQRLSRVQLRGVSDGLSSYGMKPFEYDQSTCVPTHHATVNVCGMFEKSGNLDTLKLILRPMANIYGATIPVEHEHLFARIVHSPNAYVPSRYPISEAYPIWAMLERVVLHNDKLNHITVLRQRRTVAQCQAAERVEGWESFLHLPFLAEAERRGWGIEWDTN